MREPDPLDVAIGQRIQGLRKSRKLTLTRLSRAIGVSYQQVQRYELGLTRVPVSTLIRIARELDASVGALADGGEVVAEVKSFAPVDRPVSARETPVGGPIPEALGQGQTSDSVFGSIDVTEATAIVEIFGRIADSSVRRAFIEVVKVVSRDSGRV